MGSICCRFCNCYAKKKSKKTEEKKVIKNMDPSNSLNPISFEMMAKNHIVPSDKFPDEVAVHLTEGYQMTDNELGRGAFGTVYETIRLSDKRALACKVIDLSNFEEEEDINDERLADLKNEIFTLKRVEHFNVIVLFSAYIINNKKCYIVMEKASGGTLDLIVRPGEPLLTEITLKQFFAQMVSGLYALHTKHGIAHKDLKLSNILVCETNGQKVMKISDFGLSRTAYKKKSLIRGKRAEGTVFYFSPELLKLYIFQMLRKKHKSSETIDIDISKLGRAVAVDPFSADIYALGVCLYKMTNQRHPFNAREKTLKMLYKLYFDQMVRRYEPMQRDVSPELKDLLDAMFEPNYKTRIDIKEIPGHRWLIGCEEYLKIDQ